MQNKEIRELIARKRVRFYEVAAVLGISTTHFSRLLQRELNPERKEQIIKAVNSIVF